MLLALPSLAGLKRKSLVLSRPVNLFICAEDYNLAKLSFKILYV
jgi:hypothetical protein